MTRTIKSDNSKGRRIVASVTAVRRLAADLRELERDGWDDQREYLTGLREKLSRQAGRWDNGTADYD